MGTGGWPKQKRARKDYPKEGIKKGEMYWWWQFIFHKPCRSKDKPVCCPHCGRVAGRSGRCV